jgi:RNA polymerase sigma-70 factor (ECF subfamily)
VPFSSLETPEGPTVDPAEFRGDGHWRSAPARLDADPESSLLAAELRTGLLRAVDELPDNLRAVITLRDLAGLSAEEVCGLLEITDGNQRVLLHRARARVRKALVPLVEVSA